MFGIRLPVEKMVKNMPECTPLGRLVSYSDVESLGCTFMGRQVPFQLSVRFELLQQSILLVASKLREAKNHACQPVVFGIQVRQRNFQGVCQSRSRLDVGFVNPFFVPIDACAGHELVNPGKNA